AALVELERRRVGFGEAAIEQLRDARVKQRHIQPPAQQTSIHNAVVPMRAERLGQYLSGHILGYRFIRRDGSGESVGNLSPYDLFALFRGDVLGPDKPVRKISFVL